MPDPTIVVDRLQKRYGDVVAVQESSFKIESGKVFGLIGPNGAGKTTTLKAIAGLVEPSGGSVRVLGRDPRSDAARSDLGWLPEESRLYEEMTARSYLRFFASLYDVPDRIATERIESLLDRLELAERNRVLGDCSKGMRRKVAIARSQINDPAVVIFDEPASGLDPFTTETVIQFTRELAEQDTTVLFSAHDLNHVERVSDRVAIMRDGAIVTRGTVSEIREAHGGTKYHVYTGVPVAAAEPVADGYRTICDTMAEVESVRDEAGGEVIDIRTEEPSLEEIFLQVAGPPTEDAEA